jgi:hypothetical protein
MLFKLPRSAARDLPRLPPEEQLLCSITKTRVVAGSLGWYRHRSRVPSAPYSVSNSTIYPTGSTKKVTVYAGPMGSTATSRTNGVSALALTGLSIILSVMMIQG